MKLTILSPTFHAVLRAVAMHASKDTTRPHLNSVLVRRLSDGATDVVATDAHRLAIYRFKAGVVALDGAPSETLIPLDTVNAWLKMAKKDVTETTLDASACTLSAPGLSLSWRKVEAQFPPYSQVLPSESMPHVASMNAVYLGQACDAFANLSKALGIDAKRPSGEPAIAIRGSDEKRPDLGPITIVSPSCPGFAIVIMPIRAEEKGPLVVAPLRSTFALPSTEKKAA